MLERNKRNNYTFSLNLSTLDGPLRLKHMGKNGGKIKMQKLIFSCSGESEMFPWVGVGSLIFLVCLRELCFTSFFSLRSYCTDVCACSH